MSSHGPPLSQVMHKRTPMKNPGRFFCDMRIAGNGKGGDSLRFYDAKLEEAKEILNQMDVKHDATVWKALLAACGKGVGLAYHSEKLAVALGLLASQTSAPIRVFKNVFVEIVLL
ncbi:hypothetical protein glysoja_047438 [Glycine soja]|uniref:Pentatricopeptide repeat-containing protein n=1 Tax=Glycine soja TaxID=3848 RepID=A0A0B2QSC4_GLYSO|nr:hypothetical protein glysoja_047438 [Glycine soja]